MVLQSSLGIGVFRCHTVNPEVLAIVLRGGFPGLWLMLVFKGGALENPGNHRGVNYMQMVTII